MRPVNPLPEHQNEDAYYTHCRTEIDRINAETERQALEAAQRADRQPEFVPSGGSGGGGGTSSLAKTLGLIGLALLGLYGWAQTEHWGAAALYGGVGLIIGGLVGGVLHFIYTRPVATMVIAGGVGYLYFSNYLAPFGLPAS